MRVQESWKGDVCYLDGRVVGRVVPSEQYGGMWHPKWPDGFIGGLCNRTRAKDAIARTAFATGRAARRKLNGGGEEAARRR
jgi:hypothetical protein